MTYMLTPRNKSVEPIDLHSNLWRQINFICWYVFPLRSWDPNRASLTNNSDYRVNAYQAKVMALLVTNHLEHFRSGEEHQDFDQYKVRPDRIERMGEFADFAEKSSGFTVG